MRELGINMHAITGLTDEAYIDTVAANGLSKVFAGPWEHERLANLADYAAKRGASFEMLHAPFGHINDMWFAGEDGDAMLKELTDCVDGCVAAGAGIAAVHLSSGENAPPITDIGRGRFEALVAYANKRGIKIAFENQRKLANLAWAFETFTPADGVGFCWDCGHEACFTPGRAYMPLFGDRLICTHLHDNRGVYNQDLHLLPFDGTVSFTRVTDQLRQYHYQGNLTLEAIVKNSDQYNDITPQAYLEKAAAAVKRLAWMLDGE